MSKSEGKFKSIPLRTGSVNETTAPHAGIGRMDFVKRFWRMTKAGGNIHVLSERRMGKTWAMWLAIAKKPTWANPVFFDVEQVNTVEQFVWKLNLEMHRLGIIPDKIMDNAKDWYRRLQQRIKGQSIGKFKVPIGFDTWDTFLEDTIRNFVENSSNKTAVLIID